MYLLSNGLVSTLAGVDQTSGSRNGIGTYAKFNSPGGVSVSITGNVYVADTGNQLVRVINRWATFLQ